MRSHFSRAETGRVCRVPVPQGCELVLHRTGVGIALADSVCSPPLACVHMRCVLAEVAAHRMPMGALLLCCRCNLRSLELQMQLLLWDCTCA